MSEKMSFQNFYFKIQYNPSRKRYNYTQDCRYKEIVHTIWQSLINTFDEQHNKMQDMLNASMVCLTIKPTTSTFETAKQNPRRENA